MRDFNKIDFFIQKRRIKLVDKYIPNGSYLLDIGCGFYPENLLSLESKINKGVGIDRDIPDISPSDKINFIRSEINDSLPFKDNEFDCITMLAVLEHLEHPKEIVRECYRALKPDGRLIITVPSNISRPLLEFLAITGVISREEIFSHKNYFSKDRLSEILIRSGLKMIVSEHYNMFMNLLFVCKK